jgi:aminoglycoside phosphotransferase (APT) family kinase protein
MCGAAHRIIEYLRGYEADRRAAFTRVQHGDPVFSNVLLQGDDRVVYLVSVYI